jgi:hypothetical protein
MDQTTINIIGSAIMAGLGWFARTLYDKQEAHNKDLADFKVKVATEYVANTTFTRVMDDVRGDVRYIRDRIDEIQTPMRRQGDHT